MNANSGPGSVQSRQEREGQQARSTTMIRSLGWSQQWKSGVPLLLMVIVALPIPGSHLTSQEIRRLTVPPMPTCSECRIELDSVVVISGLVPLGPNQLVSRDQRGRFYVLPTDVASPVLVYSADGQFMGTLEGVSTDGSKRYRLPDVPHFLAGDTMVVYDSDMVRLVTMAPSGTVLRDVRPRIFPIQSAISPGGAWIVVAQKLTREAIGLPLHLLNHDGTVLRSFGVENPEYSVSRCCQSDRLLAFTPDDHIWVAGINRYVLERWDTMGVKSVEITRNAPWFKTWWHARPWYEEPPPPQMASLWYDPKGRIWTLIRVPDPAWAERRREPSGGLSMDQEASGREAPGDSQVDFDDVWDTVIEVIDADNGSLIASARFPFHVGYWFFSDGYFWTFRKDADGAGEIFIRRVRLVEGGAK